MRLLGEASDKKLMRFVGNKTVDDLAFLTYEPVLDAWLPLRRRPRIRCTRR
jgi:hypothetical protein